MVRRRLFGGKTPEMDRNVGELLLHEEDWDQVDNIVSCHYVHLTTFTLNYLVLFHFGR